MIHLYKLTTGETVIANFIRMDETSSGNYSFVVTRPLLVVNDHTLGGDWWPSAECKEMLIPKSMVIMMVEHDSISEPVVEGYKGLLCASEVYSRILNG